MAYTSIEEVVCATGNGDFIEYRIINVNDEVLAIAYSKHYAKLIQEAIELDYAKNKGLV